MTLVVYLSLDLDMCPLLASMANFRYSNDFTLSVCLCCAAKMEALLSIPQWKPLSRLVHTIIHSPYAKCNL